MSTNKNTFVLCSVGQETSFTFHRESGSLFDCGEGASVHLADCLDDIKRVFLSDLTDENTAGLKTLVSKTNHLIVYYNESNAAGISHLRGDISTATGLKWLRMTNDESIRMGNTPYSVKTCRTLREDTGRHSSNFYVFQDRKKIKDEFRDIPTEEKVKLKKNGMIIVHLKPMPDFVYSLGKIVPEKGFSTIISGPRTESIASTVNESEIKNRIWTRIPTEHWAKTIRATQGEIPIPPIFIRHELVV